MAISTFRSSTRCRRAGRPIQTKHVTEDQVESVYSFLKKQIMLGRQAYVVYPVIEESETQALKAARKNVPASLRAACSRTFVSDCCTAA